MEIPCQWFLTFEGPNRECDYPFHAKVTGLHLDSTMRPKGCRIHVWSKSALQWALHVRCDITKTYLFWSSCISQVPYNNYRRVSTLGQCHESCNLFRCEGCGTSAQRTQLTLSGCYAKPYMPLLPPPPVMPNCRVPPYTKATTSRLLRKSETTVYC